MVTDGTGQAVSLNAYYPFGASKYASGARPTDMDFTGQRLDATGLNFYNARYYDSAIGRFVSADTIVADPGGSQGFNRYAYVRNNPMRYTDPSGHFLQCTSSGSCYDDGYSTSNPSFTSSDADERREQLLAYNNNLYEWAHKGWITDLEAFAQLADYAASMIPNNYAGNRTDAFVYDMASVLTEIEGATYYSRAKKLGVRAQDIANTFERVFYLGEGSGHR